MSGLKVCSHPLTRPVDIKKRIVDFELTRWKNQPSTLGHFIFPLKLTFKLGF